MLLLAIAVVSYVLFQQFVYPGYLALPVPYHNDMYWPVGTTVDGVGLWHYLQWPRPTFYAIYWLAGHLGLEGSLLALGSIVIVDIALVVFALERFVIRSPLPLWLAFGTMLLIMVGPGFFAQPAFDVGYHLAMLFTMLGILVWESYREKHAGLALVGAGALFAIGTLANEGFVPVLGAYAVVAAVREGRSWRAAGILGIALGAIAAAVVDGRMMHSPFIALSSDPAAPYHVDLSPGSLAATAHYYLPPLLKGAFVCLGAACIAGLYRNRRLPLAAGVIVVGFALIVPYLLLPNHLADVYQWTPVPVLALLVPLAWIEKPEGRWRFANIALIAVLAGVVAYQTTRYPFEKRGYRATLEGNRAMIAALREHAAEISRARNVLVRGLTLESNPWANNADIVSAIVPFSGTWWVETEPGGHKILEKPDAHALAPGEVNLHHYDLVLDFKPDGTLAKAYEP